MSKGFDRSAFIGIQILLTSIFFVCPVRADELEELKTELHALKKVVQELKRTTENQQHIIERLSAVKAPSVSTNSAVPTAATLAPGGASQKVAAPFIPDIGVVADITGVSSESKADEEGNDRISVRELELVFGHDVDPYTRLDATISFSDSEAPDIEEAYVSYWDLPFDLKGRLGRIRPKVGKAAAVHRDVLDTVDEPLVVQRYFGSEGLSRSALELSGFTPLSGESLTQQLTAGVMEGGVNEGGELFGDTRRHPSLYSHLSNFFEFDDFNDFELGGTYLLGSNYANDTFDVNALGVDLTYNHVISPTRKVKVLSEAYFQDRHESDALLPRGEVSAIADHPFGFYSLADYRLNERWGAGVRYDYVEPVELTRERVRDHDQAMTGYLTFFQSEFARWRLEYQYARLFDGLDDQRLFLQGTFAIGTHKHQLQ